MPRLEFSDSQDGMVSAVWGPALWFCLTLICFNYPVEPSSEQKSTMMVFIHTLLKVLPCGICRTNARANLRNFPLRPRDLESRATLITWIVGFHNQVNKCLKRPTVPLTQGLLDFYELFRARCDKTETGCETPVTRTWACPIKLVLQVMPRDVVVPGGAFHVHPSVLRSP